MKDNCKWLLAVKERTNDNKNGGETYFLRRVGRIHIGGVQHPINERVQERTGTIQK
jgi:hypothetical protein